MKISIDIRALQDKIHSGVQEYILNLLEQVFEFDGKNEYILFSTGRKKCEHKRLYQLINKHKNVKTRHIRFPNKLLAIFWKFFNWPNLDKILENPDILFAPNLNILPKELLNKTIITFHDLSFERFNQFFSFKSRAWHRYIRPTLLARKAKALITVSESTKQDLEELYSIDRDKINVIYLGKPKAEEGSNKDKARIKKKYDLPNKFILYVGTLEPRKNIIGIIKAYNLLRRNQDFSEYKLVLAGPRGWLFKEIFREIRQSLYRKDIIVTGAFKDKERAFLYKSASVFIYPSFFEGFGLPVLEAMSYGLPVVTSNRSSLPMVAGEGAIMIDPYRIGEITWSISEILNDKRLYKRLVEHGLKRADLFKWEDTARKTLKLFEDTYEEIQNRD